MKPLQGNKRSNISNNRMSNSNFSYDYVQHNLCISTTAIHLLAMSPAKKTSENKDYCKRYREKNCEKNRKNDAERKRAQRVKVKLQNPELYTLKRKEERERK